MAADVARRLFAVTLVIGAVAVVPARAQVTTGVVTGTVRDDQGAVVPGAAVALISVARGTRVADTHTSENGDFVFPNVTADTYVVEVALQGFRTVRREGVNVSPGDRVVVPPLTLSIGGLNETVTVAGDSPLIQAASGERSFTVATESVKNLPFANRNFAAVATLVPGVGGSNIGGMSGVAAAGGVSRIGGGGQNNIMMDGLSTMDTGNNGQNIQMNTEGIAEVKVLTQGYQAEYGRSSGLQITAVTKSGTNQFRGSLYTYERRSDWASNSWVNIQNGDPKPVSNQRDWGYSIGGPVGRPGGQNKVFFFYSHEYRPRTTGGNINRFRVPTARERQGDFSQSRDNLGQLFPYIRDHSTGLPCGAADTRGCFQDGGVLGRIPQSRLYASGVAILNRWPTPNHEQLPGEAYNLEITAPTFKNSTNQPVMRADYQLSSKFRVTGKYAGQWAPRLVTPGSIPGVNDTMNWNPNRHAPSVTVNYTMTPTTFLEASYGYSFNEIDILFVNPQANRLNGLADLPMLFPTAGQVFAGSHADKVLTAANSDYYANGTLLLPPVFTWGNRISSQPPNWAFALININPSHDLTVSLTKILSRHTLKAGFYWNHAFKAQQEQLGASNAIRWQGDLDFGNNTANPLDTQFGFANAATGVFNAYAQRSFLVEGQYLYNNIDFYIQDNWKVNSRLTLDYGLRFEHMQPTYDSRLQGSTFFLDQWRASEAPLLYAPACVGGVNPCSGTNRRARDPRSGELLGVGSAALIGQLVPNSGNTTNGIVRQGDGISKYGYTWPGLLLAPRFGAAYDLTGAQRLVIRGGVGLFHDRPAGDTAYNQVTNPPFNTSRTVRFGLLQNLSSSQATQGPSALAAIWPYESDIPASVQWNIGAQAALPWASAVDVSYVGQYGYNRLSEIRGQLQVDVNAPDIGAAFLPENQDPTLASSPTPGAGALTTDFLRPYRGFGSIGMNLPDFHETFHSIQMGWNRRFRDGFGFGGSYTLTLSHAGNIQPLGSTLPPLRLQHHADGTYSVRDDQRAYEELNKNMGTPRHILRLNGVWDLPDLPASSSQVQRVVGLVLNDWQVSGVFTGGSGGFYDATYQYQGGISSVNLTGSPSYPARIVITGDPGKGCTDNQYQQFSVEAFSGPLPGSVGLESGRNVMIGCPDHTLDLAIARNIRVGGTRNVQLRVDVFNALNTVVYNGRVTTMQLNSPTDQTVRNSQYLPNGTIDPNRLLPRNAGFGAVTSAQALRSVQAQIRFEF
jgi:hypothetical protein